MTSDKSKPKLNRTLQMTNNIEAEIYKKRVERSQFKGMLGTVLGIILAAIVLIIVS